MTALHIWLPGTRRRPARHVLTGGCIGGEMTGGGGGLGGRSGLGCGLGGGGGGGGASGSGGGNGFMPLQKPQPLQRQKLQSCAHTRGDDTVSEGHFAASVARVKERERGELAEWSVQGELSIVAQVAVHLKRTGDLADGGVALDFLNVEGCIGIATLWWGRRQRGMRRKDGRRRWRRLKRRW